MASGSLGLTNATVQPDGPSVALSGVRGFFIAAKRHQMGEAVRIVVDAIVKDGDRINKFLWKAGVGTVATAVLLYVLIARYGNDAVEYRKMMASHVADTQSVITQQNDIANNQREIVRLMAIQSNIMTQGCSNSALTVEQRDRCFDVLNGRAPK